MSPTDLVKKVGANDSMEDPSQGVEACIRAAIQRGEFRNLKGEGKPLNLDEYFETPEDLRAGFSLLKSSGFLPPELELHRELMALKEARGTATDATERERLAKIIQQKELEYNLLVERARQHRRRA